jgi:ElaB/YqjD/DUF883 family membrane-anchored ribosome-binding protein
MTDVTKIVKDAAYITVGLGVIGFQKAQVRRQELRKQLDAQLVDARQQLAKLADRDQLKVVEDRFKVVEERFEDLEERFEQLLDGLEDRLPEQAREVLKQGREAVKEAQGQVRALVARANRTGTQAA